MMLVTNMVYIYGTIYNRTYSECIYKQEVTIINSKNSNHIYLIAMPTYIPL